MYHCRVNHSPTKQVMPTLTTPPYPPLNQRGVPQPEVTTKDFTIIIFMLLLWAYSIFLTIRQSFT